MNYESFKNPDPLFHGTDFWMLNGDLNDEEIEHQLREMHSQGVHTFIARTYLGLRSDYPGPRFKKSLRKIIATAKGLGMKLFLQAGYMPEAVPGLPESSALRYIMPVKNGEEEGRRILCKKNEISFVEHNSVTFLDMFDSEAMDHYLKTCYEDMWAEFAEEYGKTILSIWVDEPSYNGAYLPWTNQLEALFAERWGYTLADKVWMLYLDSEGAESVRYHYRVLMRDLLEQNYFVKVRDWCRAHGLLFSGHLMMEETTRTQICRAQACMPYYRYFDIPGIDVLRARLPFRDDPIVDPDPTERHYNLYNTALQCTSAARQAGKKHILAEMYGVGGENFTFRAMTTLFDSYAAMGINHRSVHGIFYALHGRGKRAYPPHVGYYQPFWPKYKQVTDYCARVSAFITEGEGTADIAILHPLETGYALFKGAFDAGEAIAGGKEIERLDGMLYELLKTLKSAQHEVDFADLASIRDMGSAENGCLIVGEARYHTVILPQLSVITEDCLSLLEKMAAEGGKILCLGDAPTMIDGFKNKNVTARVRAISRAVRTPCELLSCLPPPAVSVAGIGAADILINRRETEGGMHLFLYNFNYAQSAHLSLSLPAGDALYRYDPYDAKIFALPFTRENACIRTELMLAPGESILLSIEKKRMDAETAIDPLAPAIKIPLRGTWEAKAENQNALLLEFCRYKKGDGEYSKPLPIAAIHRLLTVEEYHGKISLQYDLQTKDDINDVFLALEDPTEQEIYLDGKRIKSAPDGYFRDYTFERVFLGKLTAGKHTLEIRREFFPLSRVTNALTQLFETRYGVELEPMYLLGNFTVNGHPTTSQNGCLAFERDFSLSKAPQTVFTLGELTDTGYPFFVGCMMLTKRFHLPATVHAENAYLSLGALNAACAEIFVNGTPVGDIRCAHERLAIGQALKTGENEIRIRLYTTLFNIIGPFHRPLGNIGNTFGGGYKNPDAAWLSIETDVAGWEEHMEDFYPHWTDNYNVVPLGIRDCAIHISL